MISATYFDSYRNAHGRHFHCTSERLVDRLRTPIVTADKFSLPGIALATFTGDHRSLATHEASCGIGLDLDGEGTDLDADAEALAALAGVVYSTHSHSAERQRGRAFVWTSRPVDAGEARRCWRWLKRRVPRAGHEACDPSRFWFLPGIRPGAAYRMVELTGALLDVDQALAEVGPVDEAIDAAPVVPVEATSDVVLRARRYLERCEIAKSGEGGHRRTFIVAAKLVCGFLLDQETAYRLLTVWNQKCDPPWNESDLRRKVAQAAKAREIPRGKLLNAKRAA